jgi:hypothetical protein
MPDLDPKELLQHQEDQHQQNQEKLDALISSVKGLGTRLDNLEGKVNPMSTIFENLRSTNGVLMWLFKAIIIVGAAITAVYAAIKWIRG